MSKLERYQQIVLEYLKDKEDASIFDIIHNLENGYQNDWEEIPAEVKKAYGNLDADQEKEVLRHLLG